MALVVVLDHAEAQVSEGVIMATVVSEICDHETLRWMCLICSGDLPVCGSCGEELDPLDELLVTEDAVLCEECGST